MKRAAVTLALVALAGLTGSQALGWGATGHRLIGQAAIESLPADLPAFVRTRQAALDIGELSREPDRWRNAGRALDSDRDPAHYIDLDGTGRAGGGPALLALPMTRADYDTAIRAAGGDPTDIGYLPYAITESWQVLAKDFAHWRALTALLKRERNAMRRDWLKRDLVRREALILRDIGVLSHYVGDGSMPLHVSVHANGWRGDNPKGYAAGKLHARLEGAFVQGSATPGGVRRRMTPAAPCDCRIEARTARYLSASWEKVEPLYALEAAGGFKPGDPRGAAFMDERLAAGASELRDLVVEAWRVGGLMQVGWPPVSVREVESGRADAYGSLYGLD